MKKIILITGSTDGIGKLAAIKLAKDGHHIYLHGRNANKLAEVISEIKAASNHENVNGFVADFSDLEAVQEMANQIKNELPKIDVLINNAGVFKSSNTLTKGGFDMRIAVNYFAPYILTNSLLPLLKEGNASRIINLSSAAQATISEAILRGTTQGSQQETYAQSKLALLMWSFYLAKKEQDIVTIPVNPGSLLNTNMVREAYGKFWSSADKGADILYDLAIDEKYKSMSGKYFDNDRGSFGEAHADAYHDEKIDSLIESTKDILGEK